MEPLRDGIRLLRRVALPACVASLACAHKPETPRGPVIKRLHLEGVKQVSSGDLKKGIATSATGWWPFAEKKHLDPVAWQTDLHRIERIYEAHGFYQAEVVSDQVKPVQGGVELKAVISEGSPTRIVSLTIHGLEPLTPPETKQALGPLSLKQGDIFLEDRWEAAKAQLAKRLRNMGFAQVAVEGRVLVDVKTKEASLLLVVQLGRKCRFGDIEVHQGARSHLAPLWISEQVRLAIPAGETYSDDALAEGQRRVFAMGLFTEAKVTTRPPDPNTGLVPIVVETGEAPFRTLRAGGGFYVDQIRSEARLRLEWSHRNFLGGMRKLTARAEGGWAFIPNIYAFLGNNVAQGARNGPIAHLGLEFEQPRLLGRPSLRERTTFELERMLQEAYDDIGARLSTGPLWQPHSTLSLYATYNLQGSYLNGPAIASVNAAPLTLGCATHGNNCFILLSYIEEGIVLDRRDSPLEARRGFFASLSLQQGGGPLGGDFSYVRVLPDMRGYLSLGHTVTFASRLRLGELVHGSAASAVVTRFFAGGGVSMRGFSDRRLSPLLIALAPQSTVVPNTLTLPIGGNGLLEGNFEVRFTLTKNLILAVFADFGQVTQGLFGVGDVPTVLWALGLGFRYRTPIGPIRLDFARRLQLGQPPPLLTIDTTTGRVSSVPYAVNDSCFGLGGSGHPTPVADSLCVLNIAIGEDF